MRFYVSNIELIDDVLSCNKDVNLTILLQMFFVSFTNVLDEYSFFVS